MNQLNGSCAADPAIRSKPNKLNLKHFKRIHTSCEPNMKSLNNIKEGFIYEINFCSFNNKLTSLKFSVPRRRPHLWCRYPHRLWSSKCFSLNPARCKVIENLIRWDLPAKLLTDFNHCDSAQASQRNGGPELLMTLSMEQLLHVQIHFRGFHRTPSACFSSYVWTSQCSGGLTNCVNFWWKIIADNGADLKPKSSLSLLHQEWT